MTDMAQVLRLVAGSGFVMKDYEIINVPSMVETASKEMYYEINKKPFILNKRLMISVESGTRVRRAYVAAFKAIQDIAIVNPVTKMPDFVKR